MISEKCFTQAWLDTFKKQKEHKSIQSNILEKMIYALHLVEQLKIEGLDFVFKGGTSLVLLLNEENRFSIDIDIVCSEKRENLESILDEVVEKSRFKNVRLDEKRSYKSGIPKAHYLFQFDSVFNIKSPAHILLDVLIEDSIYPSIIESPIQTKWIESDSKTTVTTPSIDSIAGDKLTAFSPNTIGIPYFKSGNLSTMEICKQLFDLSKLFDRIENVKIVANSFHVHAEQEIKYRESEESSKDLTPGKVLWDVIQTCLIITKRERNEDKGDKEKFQALQRGIVSFGSGYLMSGKFRIDDAIVAAAKVAHLAAKIMANDFTNIEYYQEQDVKDLEIGNSDWSYLNRLKRQPDKSSFYYWFRTIKLIT